MALKEGGIEIVGCQKGIMSRPARIAIHESGGNREAT
jgi:hypothetical protein